MLLTTPHFGDIEVDESTVIHFPLGLPGFEHCHRFKLLHEEGPDPKVLWLQCLDDTELFFSVVESHHLGVTYKITLSEEESVLLESPDPSTLVLLLTLAKKPGRKIRANTQAPILLNPDARIGLQKGGLQAEIVFSAATNDEAGQV